MFHIIKYEDRLAAWNQFRQELELSDRPLEETIEFYDKAPRVSINTDPWDKDTWPDPWQLILENQYCTFCTVLGICYSLQLTDCFKDAHFEIHIGIDRKNSSTYYLLKIDDKVIGWNGNFFSIMAYPKNLTLEKIYTMEPIQ